MSINFTDYEMSAKELAFTESIMKDLDMSLGHDEYDYITNNSWTWDEYLSLHSAYARPSWYYYLF